MAKTARVVAGPVPPKVTAQKRAVTPGLPGVTTVPGTSRLLASLRLLYA